MKTSAIFVVVLVVYLAGCTSGISYTPLSAKKYAPTVAAEVEMVSATIFSTLPAREFVEIGTMEIAGNVRRVTELKLFSDLRKKAAETGANALILQDRRVVAAGTQVIINIGERIKVAIPRSFYVLKAVAIRWK